MSERILMALTTDGLTVAHLIVACTPEWFPKGVLSSEALKALACGDYFFKRRRRRRHRLRNCYRHAGTSTNMLRNNSGKAPFEASLGETPRGNFLLGG